MKVNILQTNKKRGAIEMSWGRLMGQCAEHFEAEVGSMRAEENVTKEVMENSDAVLSNLTAILEKIYGSDQIHPAADLGPYLQQCSMQRQNSFVEHLALFEKDVSRFFPGNSVIGQVFQKHFKPLLKAEHRLLKSLMQFNPKVAEQNNTLAVETPMNPSVNMASPTVQNLANSKAEHSEVKTIPKITATNVSPPSANAPQAVTAQPPKAAPPAQVPQEASIQAKQNFNYPIPDFSQLNGDLEGDAGVLPQPSVSSSLSVLKKRVLYQQNRPAERQNLSLFSQPASAPVAEIKMAVESTTKNSVGVSVDDAKLLDKDAAFKLYEALGISPYWTDSRVKNAAVFLIKIPSANDNHPTAELLHFFQMHSIYKKGDELQGVYKSSASIVNHVVTRNRLFECQLSFRETWLAGETIIQEMRGETNSAAYKDDEKAGKRRAREGAAKRALKKLSDAFELLTPEMISALSSKFPVQDIVSNPMVGNTQDNIDENNRVPRLS